MSHMNKVQVSAYPWWPVCLYRFIGLLQALAKELYIQYSAWSNRYVAMYTPSKPENFPAHLTCELKPHVIVLSIVQQHKIK